MSAWSTALTEQSALQRYIEHHNTSLSALIEVDIARGLELQARSQPENSRATTTAPPDLLLQNVPIAIKDNIAVEGFGLTCGSKILEHVRAPYSATAVQRLLRAGVVPIAKANLDEFGMGSDSQHSYFGEVKNPWNQDYVPGGSSGGSAVAVATGMVPLALGSDTGGSVRQPAAFCGVYGLKPTYGAVSRFGLVAYASSLETIGILSDDIARMQALLAVIAGYDPLDQTTRRTQHPHSPPHSLRLGYLTQQHGLDDAVATEYNKSIAAFKELGYSTTALQLPYWKYIAPAYYTIATAEASSNLARYDAVKYGYRSEEGDSPEEMTKESRRAFGHEVQLRILLGTYVLRSGFQERYYLQAQSVRRALQQKMASLFTEIDALLLPVFPTPPFKRGGEMNEFQQKQADCYTSLANLTGHPSLSLPVALTEGLPIGVQLMGADNSEKMLLAMAHRYRQVYQAPRPPAYPGLAGTTEHTTGETPRA